jgi:5-methylcytosine-specific restriction endonuclease McrA
MLINETAVFYKSIEWKKIRLTALRRCGYQCETCGKDLRGKGSSRVDHIKPVRTHPHLRLDLANLRCLCPSCDNMRHSEKGRGGVEKVEIGVDGYPAGWA